MRRMLPYLVLNIAVSALTVLVVLIIWSRAHPCVSQTTVSGTTPAVQSNSTEAHAPTLPPLAKDLFEVEMVIGSGDLENEHIHLHYLGDVALNLQGWKVVSDGKTVYTFPAFIIYTNGAFDLYSKAGANTAIELYANSTSTFWKSGERLKIFDPNNNLRLNYLIP